MGWMDTELIVQMVEDEGRRSMYIYLSFAFYFYLLFCIHSNLLSLNLCYCRYGGYVFFGRLMQLVTYLGKNI